MKKFFWLSYFLCVLAFIIKADTLNVAALKTMSYFMIAAVIIYSGAVIGVVFAALGLIFSLIKRRGRQAFNYLLLILFSFCLCLAALISVFNITPYR